MGIFEASKRRLKKLTLFLCVITLLIASITHWTQSNSNHRTGHSFVRTLIQRKTSTDLGESEQPAKHLGQYFWFSGNKNMKFGDKRALFLHVFYDARLRIHKHVFIRVIVTSTYNISKTPLFAVAWYENNTHVCKCAASPMVNHDNFHLFVPPYDYVKFMIKCLFPLTAPDTAPDFVSMTHFPFLKQTNMVKPELTIEASNVRQVKSSKLKKIGVCGTNIHGTFGLEEAVYFVNWMETLLMLGVSDVTWNKLELKFAHELSEKVFNYYIEKELLIMYNYTAPVFEKKPSGEPVKTIYTHTLNNMISNHCMYSHIHTDWFTLFVDLDEILIPRDGSRTYEEFFNKLESSGLSISAYDMIGSCGMLFYRDTEPDETKPPYLPLFRHNKHGYVNPPCKYFRNPATCAFAGFHGCTSVCGDLTNHSDFYPSEICPELSKRRKILTLNSDILASYHFRNKCKPFVVGNCTEEALHLQQDDFFYNTFAKTLKPRVESVLYNLGFDYNTMSMKKLV